MTDFDLIAEHYAQRWGAQYAQVAVRPLLSLLNDACPPPARLLDVCCGAGNMAALLAHAGFTVDGFDIAPRMVQTAAQVAPAGRFWVADACAVTLPPTYDVAISTYNSLNHLLSEDQLTRALSGVAAALRPGGLFVFDLNTAQAAQSNWNGVFAEVTDDEVCVVRAELDDVTATAISAVTLIRRSSDGWNRIDTQLRQRLFSDGQVTAALDAAGFVSWQCFDGATDLGEPAMSGRVFYRAATSRG